jgi:hypothetical protein
MKNRTVLVGQGPNSLEKAWEGRGKREEGRGREPDDRWEQPSSCVYVCMCKLGLGLTLMGELIPHRLHHNHRDFGNSGFRIDVGIEYGLELLEVVVPPSKGGRRIEAYR